MKRFSHASLIIMLVLAFVACALPEEAHLQTALVYGVATYRENFSGYPNLSFTDDDARSMHQGLIAGGWNDGDVFLRVADDPSDANANMVASKAQILADIDSIAANKGPDSLVLFYYSGHGGYINGESVICQYGTYATTGWLNDEMISVTELYTIFRNAGLKNVVVILDSCNSGGFAVEGSSVDAIPSLFGEYDDDGDITYTWFVDSIGDALQGYLYYEVDFNYVALSAAGARESSWEDADHGIFTAAILAAMESSESDRDGDGYVDTGELYAFSAEYIETEWNAYSENYFYRTQYADFFPHLSGSPREYALWETQ